MLRRLLSRLDALTRYADVNAASTNALMQAALTADPLPLPRLTQPGKWVRGGYEQSVEQ